MTEFRKQAELLASMFAMAGLLSGGRSEDLSIETAKQLGKDLVDSFYSDESGIAALKPKRASKK